MIFAFVLVLLSLVSTVCLLLGSLIRFSGSQDRDSKKNSESLLAVGLFLGFIVLWEFMVAQLPGWAILTIFVLGVISILSLVMMVLGSVSKRRR